MELLDLRQPRLQRETLRPLFLGRSTFSLSLHGERKMPHCDGVSSKQGWMQADLTTY